jgi:hypothetical protein
MQADEPQRDEEQGSRALVPVRPRSDRGPGFGAERPAAAFLAQLLACAERLEPFRRSRRAGPSLAGARYRSIALPRRSSAGLQRMI